MMALQMSAAQNLSCVRRTPLGSSAGPRLVRPVQRRGAVSVRAAADADAKTVRCQKPQWAIRKLLPGR